MASSEIAILEYELESCSNDLDQLLVNWSGVPAIPEDLLSQSEGSSADSLSSSIYGAGQVFSNMQHLLEATVRFFNASKIAYHFSDQTSADQIDTLTT